MENTATKTCNHSQLGLITTLCYIFQSIKEIVIGTRVCSLFDEFPGKNFFGNVTHHFVEENLWHVNYDDGDEEDMSEQEVLDAANLCLTLYAEDNSKGSQDSPIRTTPVNVSTTTETSPSPVDTDRAVREENLGEMLDEFDGLCLEGNATDPQARQSHDVHDLHQFDGVEEAQTAVVLDADQCSWCGFHDHKRKTRKACPQHPNYDGDVYEKGDKLHDDWIPGPRSSYGTNDRPRLTPTSVRSAPLASSFKAKDWTVGVGAIDERSKFEPKKFTGRSVLTYPKSSLGWTVDTTPRDLVQRFYPARTHHV